MTPPEYQIEFQSVTKKFDGFPANEGISFGIRKNTVHSVIGENGAGKTTLMKILSGKYIPDSGNILIGGAPVHFSSTYDSIAMGIGMLYQHFQLIDDFTVLENVILGNEKIRKLNLIDTAGSVKILENLIDKYTLGLNPGNRISELSISERQKVEILKMLYRNPGILIFDEPTAVLSPLEVEQFYRIARTFKSEGKTIILITHKLNEIKELSDYLTVLRKGKVVYQAGPGNFDIPEISRQIIGSVNLPVVNIEREDTGDRSICLHLDNIGYSKERTTKLRDFSIEIRKNEIYVVAGVEGNGQSEIVEVILGHAGKYEGKIRQIPDGISVVPDDRVNKGMIREFSLGENNLLRESSLKIITSSAVRESAGKIISEYDVRISDINSPMEDLSGGNQQKAIFGRETGLGNELLIFVHPTRGVDLNAAAFIHNAIIRQRNSGKAVLVITSDLDEALLLSDRLGILYGGHFIKEFSGDELRISEKENKEKLTEELGKYMIGIGT